jgi:hypothetical protein
MASLFNTLSFDKDPSELTKSDLRAIIKKLEGKLGAANGGGTVIGGTGAIELDLEKAREMLNNFGNAPKVNWKETAKNFSEGTVKEATENVSKNVIEKTAGEVVSDVSKATVKGEAAFTKTFKVGRTAGIVGLAALGVATVADIGLREQNKRKVKRQQEEQRAKQVSKDKKASQYNYAGSGYVPETFDSFVQSMFNMRTGHTKMGNAKFQ